MKVNGCAVAGSSKDLCLSFYLCLRVIVLLGDLISQDWAVCGGGGMLCLL